MRTTFSASICAFIATATSIKSSETTANPETSGNANFFVGARYQAADYSTTTEEYGEVLPGPDFNGQVNEFNEKEKIWD